MTLLLDTAPGPSPDDEAVRNAGICAELLAKARQELAAGDLQQASEKLWGAAAFAVKAVAEKRRWFNEADWKLRQAASVLSDELGSLELMGYYSLARDAHFNFYRHEYGARDVEQALAAAAAALAARLTPLLAADYQPPAVDAATEARIRALEQPTSEPDQARLTNGRPPMAQRPPVTPPAMPPAD